MITGLIGTVRSKSPEAVEMNVGGVIYEVQIPLSSYTALPEQYKECTLLTWLCIRENEHLLFGFVTKAERDMFMLLMSVNGIGPKTALKALSGLSVDELKRAVVGGDLKRLRSIPGVGGKTAERMILELKDKIGDVAGGPGLIPVVADSRSHDAVSALVSLGYKQADAKIVVQRVMSAVTAEVTVEEIIRRTLASKV